MKTALEVLFEKTNGNADYISVNNCVEAMQAYAEQCCIEQRIACAENVKELCNDSTNYDGVFSAILETQLVTLKYEP